MQTVTALSVDKIDAYYKRRCLMSDRRGSLAGRRNIGRASEGSRARRRFVSRLQRGASYRKNNRLWRIFLRRRNAELEHGETILLHSFVSSPPTPLRRDAHPARILLSLFSLLCYSVNSTLASL